MKFRFLKLIASVCIAYGSIGLAYAYEGFDVLKAAFDKHIKCSEYNDDCVSSLYGGYELDRRVMKAMDMYSPHSNGEPPNFIDWMYLSLETTRETKEEFFKQNNKTGLFEETQREDTKVVGANKAAMYVDNLCVRLVTYMPVAVKAKQSLIDYQEPFTIRNAYEFGSKVGAICTYSVSKGKINWLVKDSEITFEYLVDLLWGLYSVDGEFGEVADTEYEQ